MSRLTYKDDFNNNITKYCLLNNKNNKNDIFSGEAVDKLARYEDIGEPEELEKIVNGAQKYLSARNGGKQALKDLICASELREENKQLKQQLAEKDELLRNAIVPKFRLGDEVFCLYENELFLGEVIRININKDFTMFGVEDINDNMHFFTDKIFATRQEAEARLNELKGDAE